jgi:molybdenum cofactor guanylyltransferase
MTLNLQPGLESDVYPVTGVILAGGLSVRFNRKNKALVTVGDENILDHVLHVFEELFTEIILVTNTPLLYAAWDVSIATDIYPVRSPLSGIYSGLLYATTPHIFVAACDAPFLQKELVRTVLDNIDSRADIFLPSSAKGLEPLCAVYSKKCLSHIERVLLKQLEKDSSAGYTELRILKKSLKVTSFFEQVRVKTIDEAQLRAKDPDLISFFNVNTPDDLAMALKIAPKKPKESI